MRALRVSKLKHHVHVFSILSVLFGLLLTLPFVLMFVEGTFGSSEAWQHIRTHLLGGYIVRTLQLIVGVMVVSSVLGFFSAYAVERYEFKGRNLLSWMLILPLALPSYIAAYIYADMISYTGSFTRALRGLGLSHSLTIMHLPGAIFIFAFTLFPYVYMIVRGSLARQDASTLESAALLGASPMRRFFKVALPLVRPALVAGTFLVVLETLNDYGVVSYFNVRVFSFAIFDAWFRLGDALAAIRLSMYMLMLVFALIMLERIIRGRRRYDASSYRPIQKRRLQGKASFFVPAVLWTVLVFGFFLPLAQLLYYAVLTVDTLDASLVFVSINALTIAFAATVVTVFIALMIVNFNRGRSGLFKRLIFRLASLGYAIPGAVIAIAVLLFFLRMDRASAPLRSGSTLFLSQTLLMLGFAYVVRFMAIAFGSLESAYDKIGDSYTEAAHTMGRSRLYTLLKVDMPLIKTGIMSAAIIVFIDVFKELPLTLILRPSNYDTLATTVHRYAREEMIQETAIPSLVMILISSLLIYALTHKIKKGQMHHARRD